MNVIDVQSMDMKPMRKGDGGTYLVVADDSEEFKTALNYACRMAERYRAKVGILHIIENQDFQHWGAVEEKMKRELREQGERYLWSVAKAANDINGTIPSLYFAEGERGEAVLKTVQGDDHIVRLILAGGVESAGPLITFCVGKGFTRLRVPLVIVPAHLKDV
jgi:hypothetical protein